MVMRADELFLHALIAMEANPAGDSRAFSVALEGKHPSPTVEQYGDAKPQKTALAP
jgi:hypothetical protein